MLLNSGKGKEYKNTNECKNDFCRDHLECHINQI